MPKGHAFETILLMDILKPERNRRENRLRRNRRNPTENGHVIVRAALRPAVLAAPVKPYPARGSLVSLADAHRARSDCRWRPHGPPWGEQAGGDLELMGDGHHESASRRRSTKEERDVFTHRGTLDTVERGEDGRKMGIVESESQEAVALEKHRFLLDARRPIALAFEPTAEALPAGNRHGPGHESPLTRSKVMDRSPDFGFTFLD